MTFIKPLSPAAVLALAALGTPLVAQTAPSSTPSQAAAPAAAAAPGVAVGATVYDPQGGKVGTIETVNADLVVLATAKSKVNIPKSSFALGANGPVIAMTAAQLDQAAAQAAPAATAPAAETPGKIAVTKGAAVADTQGGAVGSVSEVDAQFATVDLTTGAKVRLPLTAFGAGPSNSLRVSMSAAQISAAAAASGSTAATPK